MLNQGKPRVEELDTGDIEADIARAESLLDANASIEAHSLTSIKTFLESRNDGKTWRIPRLPRTAKKMPPYQLKSGGIVWDKLTDMERSALPVGHEQVGPCPSHSLSSDPRRPRLGTNFDWQHCSAPLYALNIDPSLVSCLLTIVAVFLTRAGEKVWIWCGRAYSEPGQAAGEALQSRDLAGGV